MVDSNEAPMRGLTGDPGKGKAVVPSNNGDLMVVDYADGVVQGDSRGFGDAGVNTGLSPGSPVWTEGRSFDGDATNSLGGFDAGSDPMFDKFNRQDRGGYEANQETKSEAAEGVSSSGLVEGGGRSDAMFERLPDEQQKGAGAKPMDADDE